MDEEKLVIDFTVSVSECAALLWLQNRPDSKIRSPVLALVCSAQ